MKVMEKTILRASLEGVKLLVFPGCALTGYPPRDMESASRVPFDELDFGEQGRKVISDALTK